MLKTSVFRFVPFRRTKGRENRAEKRDHRKKHHAAHEKQKPKKQTFHFLKTSVSKFNEHKAARKEKRRTQARTQKHRPPVSAIRPRSV